MSIKFKYVTAITICLESKVMSDIFRQWSQVPTLKAVTMNVSMAVNSSVTLIWDLHQAHLMLQVIIDRYSNQFKTIVLPWFQCSINYHLTPCLTRTWDTEVALLIATIIMFSIPYFTLIITPNRSFKWQKSKSHAACAFKISLAKCLGDDYSDTLKNLKSYDSHYFTDEALI
jgi:hypothetical protein